MRNVTPSSKLVGLSALVPIIIIILFFSVTVVPAGHVGVYDLFGKVKTQELQPGLQFKNPFAGIVKMSVKTQEYTMSGTVNEGAVRGPDAISALTKEGLTVNLDITVLFRLEADKADEVYTQIGKDYVSVVVRPQIRSTIREVVAAYEAKTIYSEDRATIETKIFDSMKASLESRGIVIEKVLIRNVALPVRLADAIEAKLTAEQQIEQRKFQVDAERQEAERKRVEAQGIADANDIIASSLTNEYLTWYWINNLDKHNSVIYVPIGDEGMPLFKEVSQE